MAVDPLYPDRRAATLTAGADAFALKDAGFEALRAVIVAGFATTSDRGSASARTLGSVRS